MKVIVDVAIVCKSIKTVHKTMRKELQTTVTLVPGMHLEDRMWKKERLITGVTFNPDDETFYLGVNPGMEECPSPEACKELEDLYRLAGWRSAAEW
jgi:hypothetical protein